MTVLVFKTTINTKKAIQSITDYLNKNKDVFTWCIDLEDCDNILRIETNNECLAKHIIHNIKIFGFHCEELD